MGLKINVGVISILRDFSAMWKMFMEEEKTIMPEEEREIEKLKKQSQEYVLKLENSIIKNYPTVVSKGQN